MADDRSHINSEVPDYDDAISESSSLAGKPVTAFDTFDDLHDEEVDGGSIGRKAPGRRRNWWSLSFWRWDTMAVRKRRKASLENCGVYKAVSEYPEGEGLLADAYLQQRTKKKRNWYTCCVFGGISGLTIM